MPLNGEYLPSTSAWARDQAEAFESSAGADAAELRGRPIIVLTQWYWNLRAHPEVELQDGPEKHDYVARELEGAEREEWWARAVEAWPDYANYQTRTDRLIPVFVLERA
jgi:F420H(2)-dependent quinone reductase